MLNGQGENIFIKNFGCLASQMLKNIHLLHIYQVKLIKGKGKNIATTSKDVVSQTTHLLTGVRNVLFKTRSVPLNLNGLLTVTLTSNQDSKVNTHEIKVLQKPNLQ